MQGEVAIVADIQIKSFELCIYFAYYCLNLGTDTLE